MLTKKKREKKPLKKFSDFNEEDIKGIVKLGLDKYTLNEISQMLSLEKKGVQTILDEKSITVPKKPNNIQRLYEQGKLNSDQFFIEATSLIKSRLMPDLIYKGYYRDGQRQISYNAEDVDDCYTYVLGKILTKYDPSRGTLATFIRTWTRGYGTTITTAQHRRYNHVGNDSSLDENYNNSIREEFRDPYTYQELEDSIDSTYFSDGSLEYSKVFGREMDKMREQYFSKVLRYLFD